MIKITDLYMVLSGSPRDLRIVLLGRSVYGMSAVGNIILNTVAFHNDCVLNQCIRTSGEVEGRHITVINTPDLLDPDISTDKLSEGLSCINNLSEPGPHVFLLVLQPEFFTEEERNRIRKILNNLNDQSLDYSMVLITVEDKRRHLHENQALNLMIQECRGRQCLINFSDRNHLMTRIDQMVKDNGGGYVTLEIYEDAAGTMIQENRERHVGKDILQLRVSKKLDWELIKQTGLAFLRKNKEEQHSSGNKMASLRIVLLGKSEDKKKRVQNIIQQKEFSKSICNVNNEQECESANEKMNDKSVTVLKTPDLFSMALESLMKEMEKCKSLTFPGPHVLLLLLKPEEFTELNRKILNCILSLFGKDAIKHSMVVITHKRSGENPQLNQFIEECGGRFYHMDSQGSDHKELTGMIEKMVRKNEWRYLTYNEETTHITMTPKVQRLNLVLCGRRGAGKTSVANALLGQSESISSSVCVKREGEICGQLVSIVEMPALYGAHLTQEEVMHESLHCVCLCEPGVHVFLLVIPVGPLTDEDKGEMETIQNTLGPQVNDITMVLFTQAYIPVDKTTVDFVEKNEDTKQLIKKCGGKYTFFDASKTENVLKEALIEYIVQLTDQNKTCYNPAMYAKAQIRKVLDLEVKLSNMSQGAETKLSTTECLRVVLIGKTGNGKSASGNTILRREEFQSKSSTNSVTTVCKKAVGEVNERTVAVVDTPGLYDTTLSNEDVQEEIAKCISLSAPGPHVFIIVLSIGRITKEELDTLDLIEKTFGQQARQFSLVLFTRGDDLERISIDDYIETSKHSKLKKLIRDCGDRFHVFNNKDKNNYTQVIELFKKFDKMVSMNKGTFYTNEMFQEAEAAIKQKQAEILKQKELEIKADMEKLKVQHETEMEKIKSKLKEERLKVQEERELREKMLKEREDAIRKEHEEKEEKEKEERRLEDEERKEQENLQRKILNQEKEEMEKEMQTQKERLEQKQRKKDKEYKIMLQRQRQQEKNREEELLKVQEKQLADLKKKQEEEMERREKEEQERRKNEEEQRQEWQRKIEEAEKGQTEMQQDMQRDKKEWEEQLKKERDRQQEEERIRRQKETETIKQQEEQQRRLREEFERERERERIKNHELEKQRREMEQKERDRIEKEFEEKKREWTNKLTQQQEDWERQRREEQERRHQEDLNRRKEEEKRLKEVEEHFRQEREEENKRREKEDKLRREQEQKKWKEMEAKYERQSTEMICKYEEDARRHAEVFNNFKGIYEEMNNKLLEEIKAMTLLKEKQKMEYDELNHLYGHDKSLLTEKIKELKKMHRDETTQLKETIELKETELKNLKGTCVVL